MKKRYNPLQSQSIKGWVIVTLLLAFLISSCDSVLREKKTLIILGEDILDERSSPEAIRNSLAGVLVFTPLIYMKYHPEPGYHKVLVDEMTLMNGGMELEVRLKDGVRFHDGAPLTATEVVRSIYIIKKDQKSWALRDIDAEVIDRLRFRLKSRAPISSPENILSVITPVSPASPFKGTGPFRFRRWLRNGVELEATSGYHEGTPRLDRIIYMAEPDERKRLAILLKGDADLVAGISSEAAKFLKGRTGFQLYGDSLGLYTALYFNMESTLLGDPRIRRAVSLAIDRERIIEKGTNGTGLRISTPFPPELSPKDLKMDSQRSDPKKAVRIIHETGWSERDKDGILEKGDGELELRLLYQDDPEMRMVVNIISQQLFEVGIRVIPVHGKGDAYIPGEKYDMVLEGFSYTKSFNIQRWISTRELFNVSRFKDREVDTLLMRLSETASPAEEAEIYGRLSVIFDREVPAAFLYAPVMTNVVSERFIVPDGLWYDIYSFYRIKDWEAR